MKQVIYHTFSLRKEDTKRQWHFIDAQNKILGKLATQAAILLMGKNKVGFTPHTDNGDYVVVYNAKQVAVTGNKAAGKIYARHTNYPAGFRSESLSTKRERHPEQIIELAVKNMLPKNRTRRDRMARLKVFIGVQHPYEHLMSKKD